jgi:predicted MFS family arabinose efflux permease
MYSIGILGSGLIGAPLAGTLADTVGVSETFLIIAAICGSTAAAIALTRSKYEKLQKLMESPSPHATDDH